MTCKDMDTSAIAPALLYLLHPCSRAFAGMTGGVLSSSRWKPGEGETRNWSRVWPGPSMELVLIILQWSMDTGFRRYDDHLNIDACLKVAGMTSKDK